MKSKNNVKNHYSWEPLTNIEIDKLQRNLYNHLREMKIKKSKEERISFVKKILKIQKGTCAFAGGDPKYCWNHQKDKGLKHLKLEWGHKLPKSHGEKSKEMNNLILLCARCNNQIQTSRSIKQLIPELEHKLKVLKKI